MLLLDGNRNGMATHFNHAKHQQVFQKVYQIGEKETCAKCHHLNLPKDQNTSCRRCHRDMYLETPMFDTLPDAAREALLGITVFPQRLGHATEYAKLVMAIVDNPLLNGEVIRLDGAIRMPPR